jgi:hypothetical protein
MTRTLAAEWGGRGVRCNAIYPGWVKTEMDGADQAGDSYTDGDIIDRVPMGRFASPEDLANAVAFLADPAQSGFINGQPLSSTAVGTPMFHGRAYVCAIADSKATSRGLRSAVSSLPLSQDLFNPSFRERQVVFVLLQPLVVVLLDGIRPAGVNLAGGVLAFLQALVPKKIA